MYGSYEKSELRAWVVTTKVEVRLLKMIKAFKASIGEVQGCDARGRGVQVELSAASCPPLRQAQGRLFANGGKGRGHPHYLCVRF